MEVPLEPIILNTLFGDLGGPLSPDDLSVHFLVFCCAQHWAFLRQLASKTEFHCLTASLKSSISVIPEIAAMPSAPASKTCKIPCILSSFVIPY